MSEEYVGIKFKVEFLDKRSLVLSDRLAELIHYCKLFDEFNLAPPYQGGSAGNLSFRMEEGKNEFIITGTKIGLKNNLTSEKFVLVKNVDVSKKNVSVIGLIEPSSESILHWQIYKTRPEINSIFHGHSELFLSVSKKIKWIETKNAVPYGSLDLVKEVINVLGDNKFVIIKNHGFLSLGKTISEAWNITFNKLQEAKKL